MAPKKLLLVSLLLCGLPAAGQNPSPGQVPVAGSPAGQNPAAGPNPLRLRLDQAIQMAIEHNHALKATRTQLAQSQAQEITAGLRPNPVLTIDSQFVPIFSPSTFSADALNQIHQFESCSKTSSPPRVSRRPHGIPVVVRIAPKLAGLAEIIGRHACDNSRP